MYYVLQTMSLSTLLFVCYYCAVATVNELRMSTYQ